MPAPPTLEHGPSKTQSNRRGTTLAPYKGAKPAAGVAMESCMAMAQVQLRNIPPLTFGFGPRRSRSRPQSKYASGRPALDGGEAFRPVRLRLFRRHGGRDHHLRRGVLRQHRLPRVRLRLHSTLRQRRLGRLRRGVAGGRLGHAARRVQSTKLSAQGRPVARASPVWNLVFLAVLALGFATKTTSEFSRAQITLFYLFGYAGLVIEPPGGRRPRRHDARSIA